MISKGIRRLMESDSAIRRIWTQGRELKQIHGADNVADMTLGNPSGSPPQALLDVLQEMVANPPADLHLYTLTAGHPEVRERVAAHLHASGVLAGARPEHVLVTAGASAATNIVFRALLEPGDEVILLAPFFPDYPAHVSNHQGVPRPVGTRDDFLPDLEAIERALGPKTRAVIVNHPNNPTGRQYPRALLKDLASLLRGGSGKHGRPIYLVSDEPYREIRYTTEPFVSPASVYEYGLLTYSFSKSHSVPGERIGYLAVSPDHPSAQELVAALSVSGRVLGFPCAPSLWQRVIAGCLDAVVDLEPLRRNRDRLFAALVARGYDVTAPDGAFYLFPRTPGDDDEAFVQRAMKDLLLFVPGGTFGCDGYFRIAYCVDDRTVDLALERLPEAASIQQR